MFDEESTQESIVPPPPLPGREDLSILVLAGPASGQFHKVPPKGAVIGREPTHHIIIADPGISRSHARIERLESGHFEIHDLESRYGLYVEGQRVKTHMLCDGDRIQLSGETVIRIRFQDAKETEILERIQEAVSRDPLTGVANRRYFTDRLEQEFAFSRRHHVPVTILMIDVDHFKDVNDTHGHSVGDEALRIVARTLDDAVRTEDLVARYGGDEFLVLSRGYSAEEATKFGERLCTLMQGKKIRTGEADLELTLSIGIATFAGGDPHNLMELLARADAALYMAKREGRNRIATWSPQDTSGENTLETVDLETQSESPDKP